MVRIRDILTRFRPSGAPGAAAVGVPPDRAAELAAELGPQLDQLTQAQADAVRIREAADREAEAIRQEATRQTTVTLAEARDRAARVRAEAADQARQAGEAEAAEVLAAGERAVASLRVSAAERMPALVDRAVAELLREFESPPSEGRARWAPDGSQE